MEGEKSHEPAHRQPGPHPCEGDRREDADMHHLVDVGEQLATGHGLRPVEGQHLDEHGNGKPRPCEAVTRAEPAVRVRAGARVGHYESAAVYDGAWSGMAASPSARAASRTAAATAPETSGWKTLGTM